jgi:hypothetical protein
MALRHSSFIHALLAHFIQKKQQRWKEEEVEKRNKKKTLKRLPVCSERFLFSVVELNFDVSSGCANFCTVVFFFSHQSYIFLFNIVYTNRPCSHFFSPLEIRLKFVRSAKGIHPKTLEKRQRRKMSCKQQQSVFQ